MSRVAGVMDAEGVAVELIHMLDHRIGFGMVKDTTTIGDAVDDWPEIHRKVMDADILVIGTPIWLGVKSSVASLAIERLYAYSSDTNEAGQYLYYGKAGGCIVTGNEDGVKACAMETLYALAHIGYTIPPQPDCGWIGEIGPGLWRPGRGFRRSHGLRQRVHQQERDHNELESDAHCSDVEGSWRLPRRRQRGRVVAIGDQRCRPRPRSVLAS